MTNQDPLERAIEAIRQASRQGRPIVPVFGAGISVSAGIPVTSLIVWHLAQLTYYHEQYNRSIWPRCRDFLLASGWPSIHQLNLDLLLRLERKTPPDGGRNLEQTVKEEIANVNYQAMISESPLTPMRA